MKYKEENYIQEKPIIVIEDCDSPSSAQGNLEEPVITIERDDSPEEVVSSGDESGNITKELAIKKRCKWKTWLKYAAATVGLAVVLVGYYGAVRLYNYYYNIGVSISVSPKENIGKLAAMKPQNGTSEVALRSDSVLGVALNMYELRHVQVGMTLEEPDTADQSVLLYTRTADYTATGKYLGSLVINGEELQSDASRLGYCAIADGNMVIGISRSDKVKDYVEERKGSYFRQFMLVSNGELPTRFFLHGKVERKALGRTADDKLYVVETRHAETLWDFADALREYGFVDAIYLTGGNESGFWRDSDGIGHFTEKAAHYRTDKHHGVAPWLVLRKRGQS